MGSIVGEYCQGVHPTSLTVTVCHAFLFTISDQNDFRHLYSREQKDAQVFPPPLQAKGCQKLLYN